MSRSPVKIERADAERMAQSLGKIRAWLSGFAAARQGQLNNGPPDVDILRQLEQILKGQS